MTVDALTSSALALPPESRAVLAAALLRSLDSKEHQENRDAWTEEAENRLAAYRRGEIPSFSREDVMQSSDE